jgi:hypothetical protein
MRITWERQDGWFDREYTVVDTDGTVVEKLGKHPSLDQLRETERQHGTRIQLWQAGLLCSACGNEITGRFGDFVSTRGTKQSCLPELNARTVLALCLS